MTSSKLYELCDKSGKEMVLVEEVEVVVPARSTLVQRFEKPFKSALVLTGREFSVDVTTVAQEHGTSVLSVRDLAESGAMMVVGNESNDNRLVRIYARWRFEPVKEFWRKVCKREVEG